MKRPFLTVTVTPVSRWRQLRSVPSVIRNHYAAARVRHGLIVSLVLCWKLAGLRLQVV